MKNSRVTNIRYEVWAIPPPPQKAEWRNYHAGSLAECEALTKDLPRTHPNVVLIEVSRRILIKVGDAE